MQTQILVIRNGAIVERCGDKEYDSESDLQKYIADHPELLAGDQMRHGSERRFLLVKQEHELSTAGSPRSRLRLDHLFLDQDGIPTLVEVKRSRDKRVHREVVGQMIEYAASICSSWSKESLREIFYKTHTARDRLNEFLCNSLNAQDGTTSAAQEVSKQQIDAFWDKVDRALRNQRVRLVFLSDSLPRSLVRSIEFLDRTSTTVEVVGVEVRQYRFADLHFLAPRVVSLSPGALNSRAAGEGLEWDEDSFVDELRNRHGEAAQHSVEEIMDWCNRNDVKIGFTTAKNGSFVPEFALERKMIWPIAISLDGRVKLQLDHLANRGGGLKPQSAREQLLQRVNAFLKEPISIERAGSQPSFPVSSLEPNDALSKFLCCLDWIKTEIYSGS